MRTIIADPNFKMVFLKNMKIGTIPVKPGMVKVNVVKTATNIFGIVSDPDLPIIGTKVSRQPVTKYKERVKGNASPTIK